MVELRSDAYSGQNEFRVPSPECLIQKVNRCRCGLIQLYMPEVNGRSLWIEDRGLKEWL